MQLHHLITSHYSLVLHDIVVLHFPLWTILSETIVILHKQEINKHFEELYDVAKL